ncbi:hypothetical protein [Carboxylicivirga sp. N1Y90]|uniref:hypothetical protein n=1 Tax=Carboxylicivirga fragile TaxID=3417571 RepID=UPI003D3345C4|nr:PD40 domain-containing protein [Marinilabiliaceae bacterium N1Y90]
MKKILLVASAIALFLGACSVQDEKEVKSNHPKLSGPYMGQKLPGKKAQIFAPGIVSNGLSNRDVAITQDGKEMYFGMHNVDFTFSTIVVSKEVNGVWTQPEVVAFASNPKYIYLEPALSQDDNKLFFLSNQPKNQVDTISDEDIWVVDRASDGWGEPYNLGAPINTNDKEFYPSITEDGTMYFTREKEGQRKSAIYRSRLLDGVYQEPELLPEQINCGAGRFNVSVAPDESYVIVPAFGLKDGLGGVDYYIVFNNFDGTWTEPINMGETINSSTGNEWSLYVTPDMKYFFFMATKKMQKNNYPDRLSCEFFESLAQQPENGHSDIYWISSEIVDELRQKVH